MKCRINNYFENFELQNMANHHMLSTSRSYLRHALVSKRIDFLFSITPLYNGNGWQITQT